MSDRYRELEVPQSGRRLDAVLMATVASFEDLRRPTRHDLKQFSELFAPLFAAALPETKRTVAAALSRAPHLPEAVARQIADEPITISAPFLSHAVCLSEEAIAAIIARMGVEHARSLARRPSLSPDSVARLAALGDGAVLRSLRLRGWIAAEPMPARLSPVHEGDGEARNERLRHRLRELVGAGPAPHPLPPVPQINGRAAERLADFAAAGEPGYFATALADALETRFALVERIMLDVSGRQLVETLVAAGVAPGIIVQALEAFFPHLAAGDPAARSQAQDVVAGCDRALAMQRVRLWLNAARDPGETLPLEPTFAAGSRAVRPTRLAAEQPAGERARAGGGAQPSGARRR